MEQQFLGCIIWDLILCHTGLLYTTYVVIFEGCKFVDFAVSLLEILT